MFVTLLKRFGLPLTTLVLTLLVMGLSVTITHALLLVFQGYIDWVGTVVSLLAPALILPLPMYGFLQLLLELDASEAEILEKNKALEQALHQVRQLSGLLPICASCKKIRDDKGYWNEVEGDIKAHSEAEFTHSICPDCCARLYPDLKQNKPEK